jgi:hypothetical protein
MKPIFNFLDHPILKGQSIETIYFLDGIFYLADRVGLHRMRPIKLRYTNLGDPYRELARLDLMMYGTGDIYEPSIDISMEDAARLFQRCRENGHQLNITSELKEHREFKRDLARQAGIPTSIPEAGMDVG